jgi:predicted lysophospholipase L1 biosynthesis ABC-type transport system permease subunit
VAHQGSVCPLLPSPRRIRHRPRAWRTKRSRRLDSEPTATESCSAIAVATRWRWPPREPVHDLAQLRLAGATPAQARAALLWEGALVAAVSVSLAALIIATTAVALPGALAGVGPAPHLAIPWDPPTELASVCVALTLATTAVLAPALLRRPRSMAWP